MPLRPRATIAQAISLLAISLFSAFSSATSLDPAFISGSGFNDAVLSIVPDKGGRLLVGGYFTQYNGVARQRVARLLPSGLLDDSFHAGAGPRSEFIQDGKDTGNVSTLVRLGDETILVLGFFYRFNGEPRNSLARLHPDGTLDENFNLDFGDRFRNGPSSARQDAEGRLVVGGIFRSIQGIAITNLARVSLDGSVDQTFNPNAAITNGTLNHIFHIYPDGRMLVHYSYQSAEGFALSTIVRLNGDGTIDPTFVKEPVAQIDRVLVLPDEKILVAHSSAWLVRLLSDGRMDPEFQAAISSHGAAIRGIDLQSDGKIILCGNGGSGALRDRGILRLAQNGTLDEFYPSGVGAQNVWTCAVLPDDRVVFGGFFTNVDLAPRNRIAGFLPTSQVIRPEIQLPRWGGTRFSLYWPTARNAIYHLQETDGLSNGAWRTLLRQVGDGWKVNYTVQMDLQTNRVYRVLVEPRPIVSRH